MMAVGGDGSPSMIVPFRLERTSCYNIRETWDSLCVSRGLSAVNELRELPLFPLNTVLFPGQALSLHIFEERYKLMINRCLEKHEPVGIVLIREGQEVGAPAIPHQVGTVATLLETERHPNGELDIIAVGQERFQLHEILQQTPYIIGQISAIPAAGKDSPRARALAQRVREILPRYTNVLTEATGTLVQIVNVPEEPASLAFLVALALQVQKAEQQGLLATIDISDMLAQELVLLQREIAVWGYVIATQANEGELESNQFGRLTRN